MLYHGSVGVSSEQNKRNLTLTLNVPLPSIVFHNKIFVFIMIFTALFLFTAYFLHRRQCQLDYVLQGMELQEKEAQKY